VLDQRGLILETTLEDADIAPATFDAITLWDVLEHVPHPVAFTAACSRLLRPGGHLFVNVPDLDSIQARILGHRWPLLLAEHLNYFTRDSLRLCAQRSNLVWRAFGRRPASFSIGYVLYRLSQHRVPAAASARRLADFEPLGSAILPLPLGEVYGVWTSPR
jgi:SAM-dependent methyltransferase